MTDPELAARARRVADELKRPAGDAKRAEHALEARRWAQTASEQAISGEMKGARAHAAVSQAHALAALTCVGRDYAPKPDAVPALDEERVAALLARMLEEKWVPADDMELAFDGARAKLDCVGRDPISDDPLIRAFVTEQLEKLR